MSSKKYYVTWIEQARTPWTDPKVVTETYKYENVALECSGANPVRSVIFGTHSNLLKL